MTDPIAAAPSISSEERERRLAAVNFARASVGLEGFKLSLAEEDRARRFIDGEMSLSEFVDPTAKSGYGVKSPD